MQQLKLARSYSRGTLLAPLLTFYYCPEVVHIFTFSVQSETERAFLMQFIETIYMELIRSRNKQREQEVKVDLLQEALKRVKIMTAERKKAAAIERLSATTRSATRQIRRPRR